ncbi:MAG: efflux RND transporter periplasmic adaptor subunit [Leptospirillum sp.]|jgi:RND family efflux transporter MFP subunit|nr:efflux RND transporter periplasmic adaptor subunit [Nitrospiraceae bacterium]MDA8150347.1 efflux RND transporter periplasmic adaptor subunit [Nitrospiraceae bacterium]
MKGFMMEKLIALWKKTSFTGVIGVSLLCLESSCHESSRPPENKILPSVNVRVSEVTHGGATHLSRVSGVVEGEKDARINSRVQARVESVRVRTGQLVRKGDLLLKLSGRAVSDRVAAARARFDDAHGRFLRVDALYQKKEASRQEWDEARARDLMASADYSAAKNALSMTRITAPFSGRVALRNVRVGDVVSPGFLLAEVLREGNLRVTANIPEHLAGDMVPGTRLAFRVKVNGTTRDLPATVHSVSPRSDPGTHTVLLRADLGGVPGLRPGSYGVLLLPSGKESGALVPKSAVIDHDGIREVFVVENGMAELRFIRTGHLKASPAHGGPFVEVLSGLNPGEKVVTFHDGELMNQSPVHVLGES